MEGTAPGAGKLVQVCTWAKVFSWGGEGPSHPEISEDEMATLRDKDVFGFQVAVNEAGIV